jgi:hypothetical protein
MPRPLLQRLPCALRALRSRAVSSSRACSRRVATTAGGHHRALWRVSAPPLQLSQHLARGGHSCSSSGGGGGGGGGAAAGSGAGARMCFASAQSVSGDAADAVQDIVTQLRDDMEPQGAWPPDLLLYFDHSIHQHTDLSSSRETELPQLFTLHLRAQQRGEQEEGDADVDAPVVLGATWAFGMPGTGVVGGGRERQAEPAMAVLAARLPGVRVLPFHASAQVRVGARIHGHCA